MLTRFIIGFAIGTICALTCLTGCAQQLSDTGNNPPTRLEGIPVDANQFEEVKAYILGEGANTLGHFDGQDYLAAVTQVTFVDKVFVCDPNTYGDQECFGITYTGPETDFSQVALVMADHTRRPTQNLWCTALGHELMHSLMYQITGDGDDHHEDKAIWGDEGVVVKGIQANCPCWDFTPNNSNPKEIH